MAERPAKSAEEVMIAVDVANRSVGGLTTPRVIGPGFALVFGYVEKLVNIGGVLAEVRVLGVIPKTIGTQMNLDQEVQRLWSTMADMLSFLEDAESVIEQCQVLVVSKMMQEMYECALFARNTAEMGLLVKRALRDSMSTSTDSAIEQYSAAFEELKERFKSRSKLVALMIFKDILQGVVELSTLSQDVNDLERVTLLDDLPGTDLTGVCCNLNCICLPTTREGLLCDIMAWVAASVLAARCCRHGEIDYGKHGGCALCQSQTSRRKLSIQSQHRWSRWSAFLFASIAYQLACFSSTFKDHILAVVKKYPKMAQFPPQEQLQGYIVGPMTRIASSDPIVFSGLIIIVVDALDECGGERDLDIQSLVEPGCLSKSIDGVHGTANDVLNYITVRMLEVANRHRHLSDSWKHEMEAELSLYDVHKEYAVILIISYPPDTHICADNQPDTRRAWGRETTQDIEAGFRAGAEEAEILVDALDALA
ncbi:hypothetical protein BV22DRAFT_1133702 [Leucogyrophana mollusca]|uniref:Uncharacterized protein n=1 Tax=Leucogyrophana mollusca TaxID=85980 RepID=A0ACB8B256_9AGAM|nr:hypothetical protein BV22DRAFT_1133702 [Leucogyrophana mollusca]